MRCSWCMARSARGLAPPYPQQSSRNEVSRDGWGTWHLWHQECTKRGVLVLGCVIIVGQDRNGDFECLDPITDVTHSIKSKYRMSDSTKDTRKCGHPTI